MLGNHFRRTNGTTTRVSIRSMDMENAFDKFFKFNTKVIGDTVLSNNLYLEYFLTYSVKKRRIKEGLYNPVMFSKGKRSKTPTISNFSRVKNGLTSQNASRRHCKYLNM